jgi:hypothetical protein
MAGVPHQCGHAVLLNAVEIDLVCLFCCAFFVVLDAWGTEGKVSWEDSLRPVYQEE